MKNIVLFEDAGYKNFGPLTKTRPVFELKTGIFSIRERFSKLFPENNFYYFYRKAFDPMIKNIGSKGMEVLPDGIPFMAINARILPNKNFLKFFEAFKAKNSLLATDEDEKLLMGVFASKSDFVEAIRKGVKTSVKPVLEVIKYPWDITNSLGNWITFDTALLEKDKWNKGKIPHATLINKDQIFISKTAKISAGVILDASEGPVVIDDGAEVMYNSVILGPAYIGRDSKIKIGSKIYHNTSVGEVCKVGGEVEGTVIHGYSNKQHEGFLGHAYIGEWCNLGADTNNSDLKNNYSFVKVEINGELVDSGSLFVGVIMGDHSKTGINTMINTGTVIGVACNIYGEGFPPRYVEDFHWGGKEKLIKYPFGRTAETIKVVMARRNKELEKYQEEILKKLFLKLNQE
jgi:UDP-N-acetylglucosamine diphosphorylase / glucose-1-phosphate thymidylyltransferase / UDP-N-acetylgalactosamine diphosphorylase / glucosamine-1-phosphate N-acetyltransferase / galactosamine-1-phosphate N-acetyltransferase